MRRTRIIAVLVALLLVMFAPASSVSAEQFCRRVGGHMQVAVTAPGVTQGSITLAGVLLGTTFAQFTSDLAPTPDPMHYSYTLSRSITTGDGTMFLAGVGLYNGTYGTLTETNYVVGGNGKFTGATGVLYVNNITSDNVNFRGVIGGGLCTNTN